MTDQTPRTNATARSTRQPRGSVRRRVRSVPSLVGSYVEERGNVEANLRLEEHKLRKEILDLEKITAQEHRKQQLEEHNLKMEIMAMEGDSKNSIFRIECAFKQKLCKIELETAQLKKDLAQKQLELFLRSESRGPNN